MCDKCRLNKLFLNIFVEEEVYYIAYLVALLIFEMMLLCGGSCLLESGNLIKIIVSISCTSISIMIRNSMKGHST